MTRGERNQNPLNIRRSEKTRWLGQAKRQCDREFVQIQSSFPHPAHLHQAAWTDYAEGHHLPMGAA